GPSAGSGHGGEPPGRGGAAAGAGHELERHLIAWLDAVEKGHLVEALSLAEDVPGEAGARLRRVSEAWNRRLLDLQTSVSRAVEQGARPLIASSSLAEATRLLDDQTNQLAALSEELSASVIEVASSADQVAEGAESALEQVGLGMERIGRALAGMMESGRGGAARARPRNGRLGRSDPGGADAHPRHRRPDEPSGPQRGHRSRPGRRPGPGLRRGGR